MSRRRRRRGRRDAEHALAEEPSSKPDRKAARTVHRQREVFEGQQRALRRRRTVIGALGFLPLTGALGCASGVSFLCTFPQEIWFAIWAALFGSFLGITIRMFLERRRFLRGAAGG